MAGLQITTSKSRTRPPAPDWRTQAAFNQLVRDVRRCERALAKAERLLLRRPWKRFEIAGHLAQGSVSEFQLGRLFRHTHDPMFRQALTSAEELNEALKYAEIAVDEQELKAARTDLARARIALAAIRTAVGSVMSLRFQRWGRGFQFDEPPERSPDEEFQSLIP
ncbi:MAG: hypothetical protein ACO1SV_07040 [Fimbriimonas sp.]